VLSPQKTSIKNIASLIVNNFNFATYLPRNPMIFYFSE